MTGLIMVGSIKAASIRTATRLMASVAVGSARVCNRWVMPAKVRSRRIVATLFTMIARMLLQTLSVARRRESWLRFKLKSRFRLQSPRPEELTVAVESGTVGTIGAVVRASLRINSAIRAGVD